MHNVVYADGATTEFPANIIIENIYEPVENDEHNFCYYKEVSGHHTNDDAISIGHITNTSDRNNVITTKGWDINV